MEDISADFDVAVLGAGVSGVAATKCLLEAGLSVVAFERSPHVGGLWHFTEHGHGVMRFTHINVSKHNYCFSDFPFPDDTPDYPHHEDMARYIERYVGHFDLQKHIRLQREVTLVKRVGKLWQVATTAADGGTSGTQPESVLVRFVAVATGHHVKPSYPSFPGQDGFSGRFLHSIEYKDANTNKLAGKRVLVVGIGNSAVDVAVDLVTRGCCKEVLLSTRSGAWVVPNYIFGRPVDLYACRFFLWQPWQIGTIIFETVLRIIQGSPWRWGLNPKMHGLQTQPTVSGTLIFHIQRGNIQVKPNISRMSNKQVTFIDDSTAEVDAIVACTGYKVDLPYLEEDIRQAVVDEQTNSVYLYKNVLCPDVDPSLAFIGYVQPASGGILSMAETQARWFAQLCKGTVQPPATEVMRKDIQSEEAQAKKRYFKSARHTLQRDPIIYNDQVAAIFGAKPQFWRHPHLAWRLLLGSCGSAQYRLQGPNRWSGARKAVCTVPVTEMMNILGLILVILLIYITYLLFH